MTANLTTQIFLCLLILFIPGAGKAQQATGDKGIIKGRLSDPALNEISGVAVSAVRKNIFYVHNDSGDDSRFFGISSTGELKTTYYFKGTAKNKFGVRDCEDIAIGPGPVKGRSYIYLADIGDNIGWRNSIQVYRFKEPTSTTKKTDTIVGEVVNLTYPDGPRDAETVLIDAKEHMLYIISKREDTVGIYRCSLNFQTNDKVTLGLCGKLFLEGKGSGKWIVSGDISADGNQVLLKSVSKVYYWKRRANEPVYTTLQRSPKIQTAFTSHGQEEAIAFTRDGKGYYVMSEGAGSKIYYYTLQK